MIGAGAPKAHAKTFTAFDRIAFLAILPALNQLTPRPYARLRVRLRIIFRIRSLLRELPGALFMKPGTITHTVAVILSSVTSLFAQSAATKAAPAKMKESKKSDRFSEDPFLNIDSLALVPRHLSGDTHGERFPWKKDIVTTVFWIGEEPSGNNPVPNRSSSWDHNWTGSYGGFDDPNPSRRSNYIPAKFTPHQNPFYVALPYNDKATNGHRPEAERVIPWFKQAYQGPGVSVCKDRWIAIRKGNRVAYAQWEDAGPFRTDHWQYVFGNERPKPNLNKGAGLDVSPAVRDYLGMSSTDVTDWKFVEFSEVPHGPWALHGDNNTFVKNSRRSTTAFVEKQKSTIAR